MSSKNKYNEVGGKHSSVWSSDSIMKLAYFLYFLSHVSHSSKFSSNGHGHHSHLFDSYQYSSKMSSHRHLIRLKELELLFTSSIIGQWKDDKPHLFGIVDSADAGSIQQLFYTISETFFTQVQADIPTYIMESSLWIKFTTATMEVL